MTLGIIETGGLKGKKIILEPRINLEDNEWLIEDGRLFGKPKFSLHCLVCEIPIPSSGCAKHKE